MHIRTHKHRQHLNIIYQLTHQHFLYGESGDRVAKRKSLANYKAEWQNNRLWYPGVAGG